MRHYSAALLGEVIHTSAAWCVCAGVRAASPGLGPSLGPITRPLVPCAAAQTHPRPLTVQPPRCNRRGARRACSGRRRSIPPGPARASAWVLFPPRRSRRRGRAFFFSLCGATAEARERARESSELGVCVMQSGVGSGDAAHYHAPLGGDYPPRARARVGACERSEEKIAPREAPVSHLRPLAQRGWVSGSGLVLPISLGHPTRVPCAQCACRSQAAQPRQRGSPCSRTANVPMQPTTLGLPSPPLLPPPPPADRPAPSLSPAARKLNAGRDRSISRRLRRRFRRGKNRFANRAAARTLPLRGLDVPPARGRRQDGGSRSTAMSDDVNRPRPRGR